MAQDELNELRNATAVLKEIRTLATVLVVLNLAVLIASLV